MLDVNLIRKEPEKVKQGIAAKNVDQKLVDDFLVLDEEWRQLIKAIEDNRAQLNLFSKERKIEEAKGVKEKIKSLEKNLPELEKRRETALKLLPNLPLPEVPLGKNEKENKTLREVGKKPAFNFSARNYVEIAAKLDLIDTERAAKVSGTRFGYLKREAALLEFALAQFALDFLTDEKNIAQVIKKLNLRVSPTPFIPIVPPVLIRPEAMENMGYTERGKEEIYHLDKDNLYLVGTSEQSVGPMHMNETFTADQLPRRYVAFSTCFRREAGSYGKDTKGILRVHQFDKLEMFIISAPETSTEEHQLLLGLEEELMQSLKIPYRVLEICSGDLGDPAAAKYDIEAWLPGQNQYRETHSTSNCTDYQARRLDIKYRDSKTKKLEFVHTLNGTAFAIGRMLIAIIENYQQKDGTVEAPKVLQKYTGFKKIG